MIIRRIIISGIRDSGSSAMWTPMNTGYRSVKIMCARGEENLDGYRMYQDLYNGADKLSDLFDVSAVFDTNRPKTGLEVWDGAE